jgi:hypothetical protein
MDSWPKPTHGLGTAIHPLAAKLQKLEPKKHYIFMNASTVRRKVFLAFKGPVLKEIHIGDKLITCNLQDSRHANNLQDAHICTLSPEKYLIALVCVIYLSLDIITKALVVQNLIKKISFSQKC